MARFPSTSTLSTSAPALSRTSAVSPWPSEIAFLHTSRSVIGLPTSTEMRCDLGGGFILCWGMKKKKKRENEGEKKQQGKSHHHTMMQSRIISDIGRIQRALMVQQQVHHGHRAHGRGTM